MTTAVEVRVCARPGCDNELLKRRTESPAMFAERKFCSIPCTRQRLDLGARRCASPKCGALLVRKTGENSADWQSRRFCGHSCYRWRTTSKPTAPARPKLPPRRWCGAPGCGLELKRKYGECGADFRKRRFCGRDCSTRAAGKPQTTALDLAPLRDTRTDWSQAACQDASDAAWWTDTGRDDDEVDRLRELAVDFCAGCPLIEACRARGEAEKFGLLGGVLWRHVAGARVPLDLLAPVQTAVAS